MVIAHFAEEVAVKFQATIAACWRYFHSAAARQRACLRETVAEGALDQNIRPLSVICTTAAAEHFIRFYLTVADRAEETFNRRQMIAAFQTEAV